MQLVFDAIAFLVALSILYAAVMWMTVWRIKYPVPLWDVARIFGVAFALQLLIYVIFSFLLIDISLRAYMVRASIIVICMSQAIPLTIAFKAWKHESRSP